MDRCNDETEAELQIRKERRFRGSSFGSSGCDIEAATVHSTIVASEESRSVQEHEEGQDGEDSTSIQATPETQGASSVHPSAISQQVATEYHNTRCRNTKKNYESGQKEYSRWCASVGFRTNTVTGDRLLQYIMHSLSQRDKKDGSGKKVGKVVIEQHVKAMCDLYRYQKAVPNPDREVKPQFPRTIAVKNLLKILERKEYEKSRGDFVDRGVGTLADGYTKKQFVDISNYFLAQGGASGWRNWLDHLVGDNMLLRGVSK